MAGDHEYITEFSHDVVGLFNTCILKAAIVEVDYDNDLADINIIEPALGSRSNIPIFYHCESASTIKGGSAAFEPDDEVLVFCKNCKGGSFSANTMKIVGFVDGLRTCVWEPWNGPDIDSKHPWDQYIIPSDLTPWTLKRTEEKGGFLEHDVIAPSPSGAYTLLQFLNIPEADRPTIPNQEIYFNISSTLSPPLAPDYPISWMQFQVTDENGTHKDLFFANNEGSHVPSAWPPWKDAIWIGDNDGKEPISIAPLTGKIRSVFYEGNIHVGIHAFYQSEFINFK